MGLSKFMGGLSDNMWNDAIELIKYVGTRGASVGPVTNPAKSSLTGLRVSNVSIHTHTYKLIYSSVLNRLLPSRANFNFCCWADLRFSSSSFGAFLFSFFFLSSFRFVCFSMIRIDWLLSYWSREHCLRIHAL